MSSFTSLEEDKGKHVDGDIFSDGVVITTTQPFNSTVEPFLTTIATSLNVHLLSSSYLQTHSRLV